MDVIPVEVPAKYVIYLGIGIVMLSALFHVPLNPMQTAFGVVERHPISLIVVPLAVIAIPLFLALSHNWLRAAILLIFVWAGVMGIQFSLATFTSSLPGHSLGWGWILILFGTGMMMYGAKGLVDETRAFLGR